MITRVIDVNGVVSHDCLDARCAVSWDGYILDPVAYIQQLKQAGVAPLPTPAPGKGSRAQSGADPDPAKWSIAGSTAIQKESS